MARNEKVLIIYYSLSGNTQSIAALIGERTGGDLFAIKTVKDYPTDYRRAVDEVKRELDTGDLPALRRSPPDMSSYDLILVGSPVWWYTVSTPVMRFLKQADFAHKRVSAFCTHEGGVGRFFEDFRQQAGNAVVLTGLDLCMSRKDGFSKALDLWIDKLQGEEKNDLSHQRNI